MTKGIGVDLLKVSRVEQLLKDGLPTFTKYFTTEEHRLAGESENQVLFYAGRFACKEAVFKCFDIAMNTDYLSEIETLKTPNGQPVVRLTGHMAEIANELQVSNIKISISSDDGLVIAYAIAE